MWTWIDQQHRFSSKKKKKDSGLRVQLHQWCDLFVWSLHVLRGFSPDFVQGVPHLSPKISWDRLQPHRDPSEDMQLQIMYVCLLSCSPLYTYSICLEGICIFFRSIVIQYYSYQCYYYTNLRDGSSQTLFCSMMHSKVQLKLICMSSQK